MKRKTSAGQLLSLLGTLLLCAGLILNSFEIVSAAVFRLIVLAGVIVHAISLAIILKRSEC